MECIGSARRTDTSDECGAAQDALNPIDVEAHAKIGGTLDLCVGPMSITIERAVEASPEVYDLIGELNDLFGAAYESHQRHGLSIVQLFEPHVRFFLARLDGFAVGCGGVALFADYAEVKRMYTRPAGRGRGVAKALLYRIEDEARAANKSVLRLETGTYQQEAIGLYERMGFRPRGPFGPYATMPARNIETSLFFEKTLL
jgi:putative acetyltransferase